MRIVSIISMPLKQINLPDDLEDRIREPRIKDLAESFSNLAPLHDPIVKKGKNGRYDIVAGADRITAHVFRKSTRVQVKVVEADPAEIVEIRYAENACRRHSPEERETAMLEMLKAREEKAWQDALDGKGLTPRGTINQDVAKKLGITKDSLKVAKWRAEQKRKEKQELAEKPPFETWGLDLDPSFVVEVAGFQHMTQKLADNARTMVSRILRQLNDQHFPPSRYEALYEAASRLSDLLHACQPYALCPYCKGQVGIQEQCEYCEGKGWMGRSGVMNAPKFLRDPSKLVILKRGVRVELDEAEEEDDFAL